MGENLIRFRERRVGPARATDLRFHYCYGNSCTRAVAGWDPASGDDYHVYVEGYGGVLRILQACSMSSGSERVTYNNNTNQCMAYVNYK
ncbi:hypothetical protein H4CHR_03668 [Variovorax sp. PBS-H4]|nr:hypothetical protein H4CHR_03668 [Variovorax sp. PBS-H4]